MQPDLPVVRPAQLLAVRPSMAPGKEQTDGVQSRLPMTRSPASALLGQVTVAEAAR